MRKILITIILISLFAIFPDTVMSATQTFVVTGGYNLEITTTGNFNTSIDTDSGNLNSVLNINMAVVTNDPNPITSMDLKFLALNSLGGQSNALRCSDFTPNLTSTTAYIAFGNADELPNDLSVQNSLSDSPQCSENPNAIRYCGTLSIDNGGSFTYSEEGERHFDLTVNPTVQAQATNINYCLGCCCCPETYNCVEANDMAGNYEVELCITSIPSA